MYRVFTEVNEREENETVLRDGYNLKTYIVMEHCDKGTLEQHRYLLDGVDLAHAILIKA